MACQMPIQIRRAAVKNMKNDMKNLVEKEITLDGIKIRVSGRNHYATFSSMARLLHYFNIVANPANVLFDVPDFDLGDISCINDSSNTIYFHNSKGLNNFIKVIEAQRKDNEIYG